MRRLAIVVAILTPAVLAACGGGGGGGNDSRPTYLASPSAAPIAVVASPSPSPSPAPPALLAPAPVAVPMAASTALSFPLVAVNNAGVRGAVTVTRQGGRSLIAISAAGLPPGSVHSVHLHFGNCPSAGSHILVLGTLRADAAGSGAVSGSVNSAFTGPGHFVILYVGPSAGPLGACVNLG